MTFPDLWTTREDSREFDPDVIHRAACNADAPYTQQTCRSYPWAAAARIRQLEHELDKVTAKSLANPVEVPAWIDVAALQAAHEIAALSEIWTYSRKKSAIQVIVAREMMRALGVSRT